MRAKLMIFQANCFSCHWTKQLFCRLDAASSVLSKLSPYCPHCGNQLLLEPRYGETDDWPLDTEFLFEDNVQETQCENLIEIRRKLDEPSKNN
jgi:hypothetical protein